MINSDLLDPRCWDLLSHGESSKATPTLTKIPRNLSRDVYLSGIADSDLGLLWLESVKGKRLWDWTKKKKRPAFKANG